MPIESINRAIKESKRKLASEKVDESDVKSKAKLLKAVIEGVALKAHIHLD
jgi:hypothetical protein